MVAGLYLNYDKGQREDEKFLGMRRSVLNKTCMSVSLFFS
jgi:hypothetical protein